MSGQTTRRDFLKAGAAAGVGFWVAGTGEAAATRRRPGPNDRLNIGIIGAGGRGGGNLDAVAQTENIVAICDVDERQAGRAYQRFGRATRYTDFRQMLDKQRNLDAVVVSTPDHTHAVAAVAAMKLGKHVYCQKPLAHSVAEARRMRDVGPTSKVATQMGNQGTAADGCRRGVEVIRPGVLGLVREVHL